MSSWSQKSKGSPHRVGVCKQRRQGEIWTYVYWHPTAWRAFKNKSGQDYRLAYHANKIAHMRSALFYDWLKRFDTRFYSTGGKILLPLENCSAHGSVETVPDLQIMELCFLHPSKTSKIQPCDAGIIGTLSSTVTTKWTRSWIWLRTKTSQTFTSWTFWVL